MKKDNNHWMKNMLMFIIAFSIFTASMAIIPGVHALGVAPSTKIIDYNDNVQAVTARIINNDHKDIKLVIYAQGDLKDYISIPQSIVYLKASEDEKAFTYTVKLPVSLKPGPNTADIVIMELPQDSSNIIITPDNKVISDNNANVQSVISIIQTLKVNVPYNGGFAEGQLYISEGNVNDTITFTINIINRGADTIRNAKATIIIKGPTNEELKTIDGGMLNNLESQHSEKLATAWTADLNPGMYYAEVIINYDDKQVVLRKTFMIGNYDIDIRKIDVNNFRLGSIAKLDAELFNRWNQPLSAYGEMQILDEQGNAISNLQTNTVNVQQLSTATITGYWDTKDVNVGSYDVKVILHYGTRVSEKIFRAIVGIDSIQVQDTTAHVIAGASDGKTSTQTSLLFILVILSLVINIAWFIYYKYRKNKQKE